MMVGVIKQPDVRSAPLKNAYSPRRHSRIHSEPRNLRLSRSWSYADYGRPETRLGELPSNKPRPIRHVDKVAQPNSFDDSTIASSLGGDAVAMGDGELFDSPIRRSPRPRVVQSMALSDESVLKDQNLLKQIHAGEIEIDVSAHQTTIATDQQVNLSSPQRGDMSGPGPQPGPGPGPRKSSPPSLELQSNSALQQQQEWQKLRKLRSRVWSLRLEVQHRRRELRIKQQTKSVAEDRLVMHVAGYMQMKNTKSVSALIQEFQQARDEYGPLEDDCNILEDRLNRNELDLMELEERFYQPMRSRDIQSGVADIDLSSTVSDSPTESEYSDEATGRKDHPLVIEFLSKMGDVDILQEQLADIRGEKYCLESTKEARQPFGLGLAPDDQEWLDEFDATEAGLLQELESEQTEAERLRKQCLEYGLVDEEGDPTSIETWAKRNFSEYGDMDELTRFPALLPQYGTTDVFLKTPAPKTDKSLDNTDDRINHWLLIHLQSSPLDVNLLARTYESKFGPIKLLDDWQKNVLTFWFNDGTRKGVHAYRIYSSDGQTQVPPPAAASHQASVGDGESQAHSVPHFRDPAAKR